MEFFYGFRTEYTQELAFACVKPNVINCWISQYGSWYAIEGQFDWPEGANDELIDSSALVAVSNLLSNHTKYPPTRLERIKLPPGFFHPRIWRGIVGENEYSNTYNNLSPRKVYQHTYTESVVAAESLLLGVKDIFKVIEPSIVNGSVYGHRLRELLILLCTEIEACWVGVIKANKLALKAKGRYTTANYTEVCTPLRLTEWKVILKDYSYRVFEPFRYWNVMRSTSSIPWYESYNKVKHDREENFACATLDAVLEAAAALHILQLAQWGLGVFDIMHDNRSSIFTHLMIPSIEIAEVYLAFPPESKDFISPIPWGELYP